MTRGRLGGYPAVLLAAVVLLLTAAVGPAAGGVLTDFDRTACDGTNQATDNQPSPTTVLGGALGEGSVGLGTPGRLSSPAAVAPVSDHFASPSERVATPGWTPPVAVLLFGYTRLADGNALENDVRERVFDYVRSTPGAHIAGITDGTDVPRSTVRYHLRVLEEAGLIAGATVRGRHRFAPAGTDLELAAAVHDDPTRAVLEAVARFEPVGVSGVAEEIDRAPSTVAHHLDHLESAGLLTRERTDGQVMVHLDDNAFEPVDDRAAAISERGPPAGLQAE